MPRAGWRRLRSETPPRWAGTSPGAVPCADLPPVLLVSDASVVLWSPSGRRTVGIVRASASAPARRSCGMTRCSRSVLVPEPGSRIRRSVRAVCPAGAATRSRWRRWRRDCCSMNDDGTVKRGADRPGRRGSHSRGWSMPAARVLIGSHSPDDDAAARGNSAGGDGRRPSRSPTFAARPTIAAGSWSASSPDARSPRRPRDGHKEQRPVTTTCTTTRTLTINGEPRTVAVEPGTDVAGPAARRAAPHGHQEGLQRRRLRCHARSWWTASP